MENSFYKTFYQLIWHSTKLFEHLTFLSKILFSYYNFIIQNYKVLYIYVWFAYNLFCYFTTLVSRNENGKARVVVYLHFMVGKMCLLKMFVLTALMYARIISARCSSSCLKYSENVLYAGSSKYSAVSNTGPAFALSYFMSSTYAMKIN